MNAAQQSDALLTLKQAAAQLPGEGGIGSLHPITIYRWIVRGQLGIRLRGQCCGKQWFTTQNWIADFMDQLTQRRLGATAGGREETEAQRAQRIRRAESRQRLRRHGID